jgi:hypothetical protein
MAAERLGFPADAAADGTSNVSTLRTAHKVTGRTVFRSAAALRGPV